MLILHPRVQAYAWGRRDGMADIVGTEASGGPEAELWVGAHRNGPSIVEGDGRTLGEVIAADPVAHLGEALVARGVTELPFLLKILAIGRPLSLQAHPSSEQAIAGYDREERAGVPLDSPHRTYRDRSPKPEALLALEETWALCGFRTPSDSRAIAVELGLGGEPRFLGLVSALTSDEPAERALRWLLHLDDGAGAEVVDALAKLIPPDPEAPLDPTAPGSAKNAAAWIARLQHAFPGDPTALAAVFVQIVRLDAGEGIHLPAGNLHAYLGGAGVEIMAASDNVLRGGLTEKHIDPDELVAILSFEPGVPPPPRLRASGRVRGFDVGEDAFALAVVEPGTDPISLSYDRPALLLATGGPVEVGAQGTAVVLTGNRAAFLSADGPPVTVRGPGRLWWATTGDGLPV